MTLIWQQTSTTTTLNNAAIDDNCLLFSATCHQQDDQAIASAIAETIEKAVSILHMNIVDDSQYLLFEWDTEKSTLSVVVTDQLKQTDSNHIVQCVMVALHAEMDKLKNVSPQQWQSKSAEISDQIRYTLSNYLTTCAGFFNFSLVAAYHEQSRKNTVLL